MLMEKKVCCVTGHRPKDFLWNYKRTFCSKHQEYLESMSCFIDLYIRKFGYNYFICGGAIGVDTDFAEIVIGLRDRVYDHIKLEIAAPCRDQDKKWRKPFIKISLKKPTKLPIFPKDIRPTACLNAINIW